MALKKAIPSDFGINAEYWNVGSIQEDFKGAGVQVTLYGYLDQASRLAGKQPLASAVLNIVGPKYKADFTRADAYANVKTEDKFVDAIDA